MNEISGKRITFKRAKPNSRLEKCLHKLWLEAKQSNSKHESIFRTAMTSLSRYPLPLKSGADCAILQGFNKALCSLLDQCLESYNINHVDHIQHPQCSEDVICIDNNLDDQMAYQCCESKNMNNGNHIESPNISKDVICIDNDVEDHLVEQDLPSQSSCKETKKSPKKGKNPYKPVFRSGSYAILMGLLEHSKTNAESPLKKDDLIKMARKYTDESFTTNNTVRYSAWSSMTRLLNKGLVKKTQSKGAEYSLTGDGVLLANQLWEENKDKPDINNMIFHSPIAETCTISSKDTEVLPKPGNNILPGENCDDLIVMEKTDVPRSDILKMQANSFDIILLIDKNETHGSSNKHDPYSIYPDLMYEVRSLKVGDFTWIAKHKTDGTELVLPYIVERKRMDDLAASIKDGRFHEQKFRLRKCGLKNVIYLIESYEKNKNVGLPLPSLQQALANTRIQDGFTVYETDSLVKTNRFLAMMTKRLEIKFKNKYLLGAHAEPTTSMLTTFEYFNKSSTKTKVLTVTEMFIKMLLQLKGMSVEKALAITNVYKSPKSLIVAYQTRSQKEGEYLLANLKYGDLNRNVGPSVSISVFHLFSK